MRVLLRHRVIPEAVLQGKLAETDPPVPGPSLHPGRLQSPSEMWQALGGTPKAALHYTVTLSVPAADDMQLDHCERRRWVNELSKINQRLNQAAREEG